jgi:ribonuclease HII|tara:strand:+ start:408 stop:1031 length:624 start_codon:yes stop_codon:yes gene_type:complete
MEQYYKVGELEIGLDEAGRGCLLGPVFTAGVIMNDISMNYPPYEIKDSKKCSAKVRSILRKYIEENCIAFSVEMIDVDRIDKVNILQASMEGMEKCVDNITSVINVDRLLVDGNYFPTYMDKSTFEHIPHVCIPGGDDKYLNIAAASILAKEYRDEYIKNLCFENNILYSYDIINNKGYGTKTHMAALKEYGPTKFHRKSFKPCVMK